MYPESEMIMRVQCCYGKADDIVFLSSPVAFRQEEVEILSSRYKIELQSIFVGLFFL